MNIKINIVLIKGIIILLSFAFVLSCSNPTENKTESQNKDVEVSKKDKNNPSETKTTDNPVKEDSKTEPKQNLSDINENEKTLTKKECENVNVGDNLVLKSQTFPIDFEPFEGSCFVTSHNPEYDDPPIGSEIAIYKNDKKVYKFDTRYHADAATCWIEAVAFEDLNNDQLKDIIVVGKCGAKAGDIQGNEVFANNGKGFDTTVEGNDSLEDFKTVKEITNFVKKNQKLFFK